MIAITRQEKDAIIARYPNTHFVRTVKQKSKRRHYFMTEHPAQMRMLMQLRGEPVQDNNRPRRVKRGGR